MSAMEFAREVARALTEMDVADSAQVIDESPVGIGVQTEDGDRWYLTIEEV